MAKHKDFRDSIEKAYEEKLRHDPQRYISSIYGYARHPGGGGLTLEIPLFGIDVIWKEDGNKKDGEQFALIDGACGCRWIRMRDRDIVMGAEAALHARKKHRDMLTRQGVKGAEGLNLQEHLHIPSQESYLKERYA